MLELKKISKNYGNHDVLKEIDFIFEKGKAYGIIGENGAGKTTLFRCVAGLENYSGEVKYYQSKLKNHLGFLPTEPYMLSRITGKEYLLFVCQSRGLNLINPEEKNIFDLPLNHFAETYSTGMRKKLALMGLLLQNNEVFILDEPFNGVDIHNNLLITEIILKLKSLGKIIIISSHIFSTLTDTCDSLHLLKNGHFYRNVQKEEFSSVEAEMRGENILRKIDQLELK